LISQSNSYAAAHTLRARNNRIPQKQQQREASMTDILVENIKLVVLFVLIASVIVMSRAGGTALSRPKPRRHSRAAVPAVR
jgi:hypothetical protein